MKENALLQKKMRTKRLTCHQQSSDLPGCSRLQNCGNRSWGSCTETPRRSPVPTPDIVLINIYENRNVSNLLIVFHVKYLYEVGLPAVVLGEGDGAGEPLYPGGVGGDGVGEVELHHRQGQALVLPVSRPTSCLTSHQSGGRKDSPYDIPDLHVLLGGEETAGGVLLHSL